MQQTINMDDIFSPFGAEINLNFPFFAIRSVEDKPCASLICVVKRESDGMFAARYLDAKYEKYDALVPSLDGFTPVQDFGITVACTSSTNKLGAHLLDASVAEYPDGTPREWQDNDISTVEVRDEVLQDCYLAIVNNPLRPFSAVQCGKITLAYAPLITRLMYAQKSLVDNDRKTAVEQLAACMNMLGDVHAAAIVGSALDAPVKRAVDEGPSTDVEAVEQANASEMVVQAGDDEV